MAVDVTTDDRDKPLRGIVLLATGIWVLMIQDVVIKMLSGGYPVHEMLWIRCVTGLPLLLVLAWRTHDPANFRIHWPGILRGLLHILSFKLYYLSLATLPIAEAAALYCAAPLMITALSVPILREVVGIRRCWSG
tara:strand:+ start:3603 stop:4007 length:405 start_codon:yes stop_codon:yes gene_type:complete